MNINDKISKFKLETKELDVEIVNLENKIKLLGGEIEILSVDFEETEILALNEGDKFSVILSNWREKITEKDKALDDINQIIEKDENKKENIIKSINDFEQDIIRKLGKVKEIESSELIDNLKVILRQNNIESREDIVKLSDEVDNNLKLIVTERNKISNDIKALRQKIEDSNEKKIENTIQIENNSIEEISISINTYLSYLKSIDGAKKEDFSKDTLYDIMKDKKIIIEENRNVQQFLRAILENVMLLNNNIKFNSLYEQVKNDEIYIAYLDEMNISLEEVKTKATEYIEHKINRAFNTDLINAIYDMIEPHPELKKIKIIPKFDSNKPQLDIYALSKDGKKYEPALYLSSAQLNILSLSIFLARTLQENSGSMNTIFMDDTVEHLDSINTLSFIDLIRNIISVLDIQIVITTHNEDLFNLFQRKIDPKYYNAKYLELNGFGILKNEENK